MFSKMKEISFPSEPVFVSQMRTRINDINFSNHLDYAALLEIVGNVRSQFLKCNGCNESDIDGAGIILKNLYVDYLSEVLFDELLEIKLYITDISGPKAHILYIVRNVDKNKDVAKIATRVVFYNYQSKKICAAPNKFIQFSNVLA